MWPCKRSWGIALALWFGAGAAHAADVDEPRYDQGVKGVFGALTVTTAPVGDAILGEIGAEWAGLRSFEGRRSLLQWDARLGIKGGYLGSTLPFLFLIGAHSMVWGEYGLRLLQQTWSPYIGGRLGGDVAILGHPGLSFSLLNTVNNVDGVGGIVASGEQRINAGVSYLTGPWSVLAGAFVGTALQGPRLNIPALGFFQTGLAARVDLEKAMTAEIHGWWATTLRRGNALHGFTDRTQRMGVAVSGRRIFDNGMWLAGTLLLQRDTDIIAYTNGLTYRTVSPPFFNVEILFGLPVWSWLGL